MPEINTQSVTDIQVIETLYRVIFDKQKILITSVTDLLNSIFPYKYTERYSADILNEMVRIKLISIDSQSDMTYVVVLSTENVKTAIFKCLNYEDSVSLGTLLKNIPCFPPITIKLVLEKLISDKLVTVFDVSGHPKFILTEGENKILIKEVEFKVKSDVKPEIKNKGVVANLLAEVNIGKTEEPLKSNDLTSSPSANLLKKPMFVKVDEPEVSKHIPENVVKEENAEPAKIMVEISPETMMAVVRLQKIMRDTLMFMPSIEQVVAYGMSSMCNMVSAHTAKTGGMFNNIPPSQNVHPQQPFFNNPNGPQGPQCVPGTTRW